MEERIEELVKKFNSTRIEELVKEYSNPKNNPEIEKLLKKHLYQNSCTPAVVKLIDEYSNTKLIKIYDNPWKNKLCNKIINGIYDKIEIYNNKIVLWYDGIKKEINYVDYNSCRNHSLCNNYYQDSYITFCKTKKIKSGFDYVEKILLEEKIVFRSGFIYNKLGNFLCREIYDQIESNHFWAYKVGLIKKGIENSLERDLYENFTDEGRSKKKFRENLLESLGRKEP